MHRRQLTILSPVVCFEVLRLAVGRLGRVLEEVGSLSLEQRSRAVTGTRQSKKAWGACSGAAASLGAVPLPTLVAGRCETATCEESQCLEPGREWMRRSDGERGREMKCKVECHGLLHSISGSEARGEQGCVRGAKAAAGKARRRPDARLDHVCLTL